MKEVTLKENYVYKGKIIKVKCDEVMLPDGKITTRDVVEHRGGVCIVPVDKDGNVLLVRQFRYPIGEEILEIPAGKREENEEPLATAVRELSEETGCTAETMDFLGSFIVTPGYCTERFYIFLARGLNSGRQHLDEGEFLSVVKMPFKEALQMVYDNKLPDAKSVIGLTLAKQKLGY